MISILKKKYNYKTDEQLMVLVSFSDERAFEMLYDRYSKKIFNYFLYMLNSDCQRAEDLLQELFIRIFEKAKLFNQEQKFSSWIYSIASNMLKNEFRKNKNIFNEVSIENEDIYIDDSYIANDFVFDFKSNLNFLDTKHKNVIILKYYFDMSIKEISKIENCPEGTIKSRIFNALNKISEKYKSVEKINIPLCLNNFD